MSDSQTQEVQVVPNPNTTDTWLTGVVWVLVVAVLGLGVYFGYTIYDNRQRALESDASYRLITALERQVREEPNSSVLRVRLGEALGASGRFPEAIEQLNAALKIEPKHIGAFIDLGQIAMINKQYPKAERYFLKVVELTKATEFGSIDKRREAAYFHLGEIKLLEEEYEEAAGYFKESLRMRSDASDTYFQLARALLGLGDEQGAIDNLEIALTFDPGYAQAHFTMGTLLKDRGDDVNASYHFQRAAELAPSEEQAQDALAAFGPSAEWAARASKTQAEGDIEKALEYALIARNLDPTSFDAAKLHAKILVARGNTKDAYEVYLKAQELNPDDAGVNAEVKRLRAVLKAKKK